MNNKTSKSENLITPGAIDETSVGYMLKLSAPMIVMNISFTLMQFVDRFMVSRLGTSALAAILPAGVVSFLPGSFALGVMTSVNIYVSQCFGRGRFRDCANYSWQAMYMGLVYALFVLAILWPVAPVIFSFITPGDETVIEMEVAYFRIMLYADVLVIFIWGSSQFFMGIHKPVITMWAALTGQVVNVCSNYVLIFGRFGFPEMGIKGAAWGTFIGVVVGAIIRMWFFTTGDINRRYKSTASMNIDLTKMKELLKVGAPAGVAMMLNVTLWGLILLSLVSRFGKESLAATASVFSCINVSVMPIVGIATALTAAVGKSIGAGKQKNAMKQTSLCLKIGITYMGLAGICFFVFRESIMNFWSSDPKVISVGMSILICAAIFQIFDAASIIYNGALRGAGDTMWLASVTACGALGVLGLGGLLMLKLFPGLGAIGPWIAATVYVIAVGIANRWRFKSKRWTKIDLFKSQQVDLPGEIGSVVE